MQVVGAELRAQQALCVDHRGKIVEVDVPFLFRVVPHPVVDRGDARHRPRRRLRHRGNVRPHVIVADRQDAGEDHADPVRLRELAHRREVPLDVFVAHHPAVAGNVVRARQDQHGARREIDHVGPEADEHLRRRLTGDAAVDVGLAREETAELRLLP